MRPIWVHPFAPRFSAVWGIGSVEFDVSLLG
jgi:hypothetical protein